MDSFDFNQKVSGGIAFCLILVVALIFAWHSVSVGQKVVETAREQDLFNMQERWNLEKAQAIKEKNKAKTSSQNQK